MIEFLVNNWEIIIAIIAIIAVAIYGCYGFIKSSRGEQISRVQEWLLLAVAEAEKALGGGTGQLKLRYVYDMFISKFPIAAKFISFSLFSEMVDKALQKFNNLLTSNKKIQEYVGEEKEIEI